MTMRSNEYKAVLFDMGGVLVRYRDPSSYDRLLQMAGEDPEVAKQIKAFDYGKISAEEIIPLMRLILPDFPQGVTEYSAVENYTQPNEDMLRVVRRLKKHGLKVALVTNNGYWTKAKERSMILGDISPFDVVVESCRVGFRKPDSEIFNLAVDRLGVAKEECIFLDDSKDNCEGAERAGLTAVYVEKGNTQWAMAQLEHLLGLSLSGRAALVTLGCEMNLTESPVMTATNGEMKGKAKITTTTTAAGKMPSMSNGTMQQHVHVKPPAAASTGHLTNGTTPANGQQQHLANGINGMHIRKDGAARRAISPRPIGHYNVTIRRVSGAGGGGGGGARDNGTSGAAASASTMAH